MDKIEKIYNYALEQHGFDYLNDKEIWCSTDIYYTLDTKEYKGLKIYSSCLMDKDIIIIGKLFM
jgi:hypothetical protein